MTYVPVSYTKSRLSSRVKMPEVQVMDPAQLAALVAQDTGTPDASASIATARTTRNRRRRAKRQEKKEEVKQHRFEITSWSPLGDDSAVYGDVLKVNFRDTMRDDAIIRFALKSPKVYPNQNTTCMLVDGYGSLVNGYFMGRLAQLIAGSPVTLRCMGIWALDQGAVNTYHIKRGRQKMLMQETWNRQLAARAFLVMERVSSSLFATFISPKYDKHFANGLPAPGKAAQDPTMIHDIGTVLMSVNTVLYKMLAMSQQRDSPLFSEFPAGTMPYLPKSAHFIHGDIKPQNIGISRIATPKWVRVIFQDPTSEVEDFVFEYQSNRRPVLLDFDLAGIVKFSKFEDLCGTKGFSAPVHVWTIRPQEHASHPDVWTYAHRISQVAEKFSDPQGLPTLFTHPTCIVENDFRLECAKAFDAKIRRDLRPDPVTNEAPAAIYTPSRELYQTSWYRSPELLISQLLGTNGMMQRDLRTSPIVNCHVTDPANHEIFAPTGTSVDIYALGVTMIEMLSRGEPDVSKTLVYQFFDFRFKSDDPYESRTSKAKIAVTERSGADVITTKALRAVQLRKLYKAIQYRIAFYLALRELMLAHDVLDKREDGEVTDAKIAIAHMIMDLDYNTLTVANPEEMSRTDALERLRSFMNTPLYVHHRDNLLRIIRTLTPDVRAWLTLVRETNVYNMLHPVPMYRMMYADPLTNVRIAGALLTRHPITKSKPKDDGVVEIYVDLRDVPDRFARRSEQQLFGLGESSSLLDNIGPPRDTCRGYSPEELAKFSDPMFHYLAAWGQHTSPQTPIRTPKSQPPPRQPVKHTPNMGVDMRAKVKEARKRALNRQIDKLRGEVYGHIQEVFASCSEDPEYKNDGSTGPFRVPSKSERSVLITGRALTPGSSATSSTPNHPRQPTLSRGFMRIDLSDDSEHERWTRLSGKRRNVTVKVKQVAV